MSPRGNLYLARKRHKNGAKPSEPRSRQGKLLQAFVTTMATMQIRIGGGRAAIHGSVESCDTGRGSKEPLFSVPFGFASQWAF